MAALAISARSNDTRGRQAGRQAGRERRYDARGSELTESKNANLIVMRTYYFQKGSLDRRNITFFRSIAFAARFACCTAVFRDRSTVRVPGYRRKINDPHALQAGHVGSYKRKFHVELRAPSRLQTDTTRVSFRCVVGCRPGQPRS